MFSPRFIMNSRKPGGEVNTPWLHPEAIAPIRAAIRLRYRLMPYLYTLFHRAHALGEPILRPLFYEFEHDSRTFADNDDFMFGPHLLVANVVEQGARERLVYLPRNDGGWYDYHTGRHLEVGGVVVPAPLGSHPLFARGGAILPDRGATTLLSSTTSRRVSCGVFPAPRESRAGFVLYEDDGIGLGYRDGNYAEVEFEMLTGSEEIQVVARKTGRYPLPYRNIDVVLPVNEKRKLSLHGHGVDLSLERRRPVHDSVRK
jgi:alpha-glucosidase